MKHNNWLVADICDQFPDAIRVLPPIFRPYGSIKKCQGKIETILLEEDNRKLIELLKQEGFGRIVVIQCPKPESAVLGDRLATLAIGHHWGGVIVDGAIRDVAQLRDMPICVYASTVFPVRGQLNGGGIIGATLKMGNVEIMPNDYLYADEDGIIIAAKKLV